MGFLNEVPLKMQGYELQIWTMNNILPVCRLTRPGLYIRCYRRVARGLLGIVHRFLPTVGASFSVNRRYLPIRLCFQDRLVQRRSMCPVIQRVWTAPRFADRRLRLRLFQILRDLGRGECIERTAALLVGCVQMLCLGLLNPKLGFLCLL